jgi:hypothetical protein
MFAAESYCAEEHPMTYRSPWLLRSIILITACLASGISGHSLGVHSPPSKRAAVEVQEPPIATMDLMTGAKDLPVQQYDAF